MHRNGYSLDSVGGMDVSVAWVFSDWGEGGDRARELVFELRKSIYNGREEEHVFIGLYQNICQICHTIDNYMYKPQLHYSMY